MAVPTAVEGVADGRRTWLAAIAWALGLAGVAQPVVILALAAGAEAGVRTARLDDPIVLILLVTICAFSVVGAAIAARRPRHYAGWSLVAAGIAVGLSFVFVTYGQIGLPPAAHQPGAEFGPWVGSWLFITALASMGTVFLLHFPDGTLPAPGWVWARRAGIAAIACYVVGEAFRPGFVYSDHPTVANPIGGPLELAWLFDALATVGNVGMVAMTFPVAFGLAWRYRRASVSERLQIKWIAYVAVGIAATFPIAAFNAGTVSDVAFGLGVAFAGAVPVAVAFAVLRYRLYDIDRLISATIVIGALTAILAGVYTASIRLFNAIFVAVTGEESDAALVITTLILATTLTPIRQWLEGLVKGRFGDPASTASDGATADDPLADPEVAARLAAMVDRSVERALRERRG